MLKRLLVLTLAGFGGVGCSVAESGAPGGVAARVGSTTTASTTTARATTAPATVTARRVVLAEPFTVDLGERVVVGPTEVGVFYAEVVDDSRCPPDVTCVWAGNAQIRLELTVEETVTDVLLNTQGGPRFSRSACAGGLLWELVDLTRQRRSATLRASEGCE